MTGFALESDLVAAFAHAVARDGVRLRSGQVLQGVIIGHEVALVGASQLGNMGAADLLMVTEDGRLWLIEAKLASNAEVHPSFLFANQLTRYAASIEALGLKRLHARLEEYVYGRRSALQPPSTLLRSFERARNLEGVLAAWCTERRVDDPRAEARRLLHHMERQLRLRSFTLAAPVDTPPSSLSHWILQDDSGRSWGVLQLEAGLASVVSDTLAPLEFMEPGAAEVILPPFDEIPQSYKLSPATLPRVLSERAFGLYIDVLSPRITSWTAGCWPKVKLREVTSAAFSIDLQSDLDRSICLQIGRAALAGGGHPGAHPLKLIVNLIWPAENVFERWLIDRDVGERDYEQLEFLTRDLCLRAGMKVRGIESSIPIATPEGHRRLQPKMRGVGHSERAELVAVREVGRCEGYGWPDGDPSIDRGLLETALDLIEGWLGPGPYRVIPRRTSTRRVSGLARS